MKPADIKSLCSFVLEHNEHAFAGLCKAALQGEEWAVARVRHAIALIHEGDALHGADEPSKLRIIRATDTTRPPSKLTRSGSARTVRT